MAEEFRKGQIAAILITAEACQAWPVVIQLASLLDDQVRINLAADKIVARLESFEPGADVVWREVKKKEVIEKYSLAES